MELTDVVIDYVKSEKTDFAILINGKWGSGKTHFVKNKLIPEIEKIPAPGRENDTDKNYQAVYISLYGVTNTDELEQKIFYTLMPQLGGKVASVAGTVLIKAASFFKVNISQKDLIDLLKHVPTNKVWIFDDLERLETESVGEVLGFINTYTEHHNLKVLILADEEKILAAEPNFPAIKEKLIRFTYIFNPGLPGLYSDIVELFKNERYAAFLKDKKDFVCSIFLKADNNNLRTLRFVLELFYKVYDAVSKAQLTEEQQQTILVRYLYFVAVYSIQYKNGVEEESLKALVDVSNDILAPKTQLTEWISLLDENNDEDDGENTLSISKGKTFAYTFEKRFREDASWIFEYFPFLATYVHTGALNATLLLESIQLLQKKLLQKATSPQQQDLEKLQNTVLLEDDELHPLIEKVNNHIQQGAYSLEVYPAIFQTYALLVDHGVAGVSAGPTEVQMFKAGMDQAATHYAYKEFLNTRLEVALKDPTHYNEVREYAYQLNEMLLHVDDYKLSSALWELILARDFVGAVQKIKASTEVASLLFNIPPLVADDFFREYISMRNEHKSSLGDILGTTLVRYDTKPNAYSAELPFFYRLKELIDAEESRIGANGNISKINMMSLKNWCTNVIRLVPAPREDEE
jgi:hypothetical protein